MHRRFHSVVRRRTAAWLLCLAPPFLGGCATGPIVYPDAGLSAPHDYTPDLTDLAEAKRGSQVTWVAAEGEEPIPVRYFEGSEGYRPVILLHGLQSHSLWFVQSARHLSDIGHPVYAMDRRGSGLSRSKRGHARDYHQMVDDIHLVVEHAAGRHGIDQVHLLGHCFGAIPATLYAAMYPDRVRSLILPTPGIHTRTDLPLGDKTKVLRTALGATNKYIPIPLEVEQFTSQAAFRDFIARDPLALKYATASTYLAIHEARRHLRDHVGEIAAPVFMGLARLDQVSDNVDNTRFFGDLTNPRNVLKTYKNAWHILEYSNDRDTFFADLADWTRELDAL